MPREAHLFNSTDGSPVEAFLVFCRDRGNIPPAWIDRASASRKEREAALATALQNNSLDAIHLLREWELAYRKECFYYGIRALLDLKRGGATDL